MYSEVFCNAKFKRYACYTKSIIKIILLAIMQLQFRFDT